MGFVAGSADAPIPLIASPIDEKKALKLKGSVLFRDRRLTLDESEAERLLEKL